ncbi:MAG: hypothetical protein HY275_05135 [Gemmatimonadetes bacterium]|nr:hypothetical protein [Gemmatimonadota bacterium]
MTLSEHAARKLVRLNELSLVDASFPPGLESMSLTHLKQRIQRAHRLMTKYRDMAEQQRGEARGKRTPTRRRPANGNAGTVEKQHLFAEVLARLEEQLAARLAAAPNAGQHGVFAPVERHVPIDVAATLRWAPARRCSSRSRGRPPTWRTGPRAGGASRRVGTGDRGGSSHRRRAMRRSAPSRRGRDGGGA